MTDNNENIVQKLTNEEIELINSEVSTANASARAASGVSAGTLILASKYNEVLAALEKIMTHTHVYYDDYGTNCNCNCNCCNAIRGTL